MDYFDSNGLDDSLFGEEQDINLNDPLFLQGIEAAENNNGVWETNLVDSDSGTSRTLEQSRESNADFMQLGNLDMSKVPSDLPTDLDFSLSDPPSMDGQPSFNDLPLPTTDDSLFVTQSPFDFDQPTLAPRTESPSVGEQLALGNQNPTRQPGTQLQPCMGVYNTQNQNQFPGQPFWNPQMPPPYGLPQFPGPYYGPGHQMMQPQGMMPPFNNNASLPNQPNNMQQHPFFGFPGQTFFTDPFSQQQIPVPVVGPPPRGGKRKRHSSSSTESPPRTAHYHEPRRVVSPVARSHTTPKNKRGQNRTKMVEQAKKFYHRRHHLPENWGEKDKFGKPKFRYNSKGGLDSDVRFCGTDIETYLLTIFPKQDIGDEQFVPTIWIQNVPADSSERYIDRRSDKCRFAECPVKNGTIHRGMWRLAFDEVNDLRHDPFHCAGFVHLYCAERFMDFDKILAECHVRPDTRELEFTTSSGQAVADTKSMKITRDHDEMLHFANTWISRQLRRYEEAKRLANGGPIPRPEFDFKTTLTHQLTESHLQLQCPARQKKRAKVASSGNTIDKHKGDLQKFADLDTKKRIKARALLEAGLQSTEDANPQDEDAAGDVFEDIFQDDAN
jgi:hypothetical protein